jgi:hypothetical protein
LTELHRRHQAPQRRHQGRGQPAGRLPADKGRGEGLTELVEPEVPSRIELPATTVTKENVALVQNLGY